MSSIASHSTRDAASRSVQDCTGRISDSAWAWACQLANLFSTNRSPRSDSTKKQMRWLALHAQAARPAFPSRKKGTVPVGDARLGGILRLQPAIDRTRSRLRRRSRVVAPQRSAQIGSDRRAAAATLHGDRLLRKCANRERLNVSCQVMDVSGVASLVECRGGVPRRFAEPRTFSAAALVKLVSS